MNEEWTFESDGAVTPPLKFSDNEVKVGLYIPAGQPYTLAICKNGQDVGWLSVNDGVFRFRGNMEESAAELFTYLKKLADKYLQEKQ